jgi:ubiquinone/menaquinone biosynthesis C-methylase UbiE
VSVRESGEPRKNLGAGKWSTGYVDAPIARQRAYYAQTAEMYETTHVQDGDEHHVALRHIAFYLRWIDAQSVLDTGCGTGRTLRFLREQLPGAYMRGNDPSEELLRIAVRDHGVPADTLDSCSSEQLPYKDASFDAVVATGLLHHVPKPEKVIREMVRVARLAVFISDCNIYGQGGRIRGLAKRMLARAHVLTPLNWIRRGGHLWYWSEGDGIAYSYSVYDSIPQLRHSCPWVIVTPTQPSGMSGGSPLSESSHCLVSAFKTALTSQRPAIEQ